MLPSTKKKKKKKKKKEIKQMKKDTFFPQNDAVLCDNQSMKRYQWCAGSEMPNNKKTLSTKIEKKTNKKFKKQGQQRCGDEGR